MKPRELSKWPETFPTTCQLPFTQDIGGTSAAVYQINAQSTGPSSNKFKYKLPSTAYAGSVAVVN